MRSFDRRGLELAVSTIVVLIVSVIILSLAIGVTYQAFCSAEDLSRDVDSQQAERIDQLMTSVGGKVVVGDNTKDAQRQTGAICGGGAIRAAQFTVGLRAPLDGAIRFRVEVQRTNAPDGTQSNLDEREVQLFGADSIDSDTIVANWQVPRGRRTMEPILITLPGGYPSGQYVYTLTVRQGSEADSQVYGAQQLYVIAE